MDVELEEVEERVVDEGDGAVDLALGAVVELERLARLVADGEGDPLDLVVGVFQVLARLTGPQCQRDVLWARPHRGTEGGLRAAVHALDLDGGAIVVRRQRILVDTCDASGQGAQEEGAGGGTHVGGSVAHRQYLVVRISRRRASSHGVVVGNATVGDCHAPIDRRCIGH